jgi:hypothetical protein
MQEEVVGTTSAVAVVVTTSVVVVAEEASTTALTEVAPTSIATIEEEEVVVETPVSITETVAAPQASPVVAVAPAASHIIKEDTTEINKTTPVAAGEGDLLRDMAEWAEEAREVQWRLPGLAEPRIRQRVGMSTRRSSRLPEPSCEVQWT